MTKNCWMIMFETLDNVALVAVEDMEDRGIVLDFGSPADVGLCGNKLRDAVRRAGHLGYGARRSLSLPITSLDGKPTRKYFHVTIWRGTDGRYGVNTYVL